MATIIQFPNSISFLENLKAVRIASSETVAFKLSSGGSTILEETYSPGPSGIVEVELRDVISEYLAISYPSSDVFNQASAIAQMTVSVDGGSGQNFTVLSGGVRGLSTTDESFLRANWLTWQPQTKTVRWNQPEYLTFAHLSAGTVKAKFYPKAGGSETVTLHSASAGQVNTYRMQMSTLFAASSYEPKGLYGLVDVWVENGGVQQSYVQRYVCTPETRDEHYFSCVNSLGGVDTFCFTGARILSPSVEHASALRGDSRIDITPEPARSWTQGTGDLDKAESRWIWDFFNSSRRWAEIDGALEEIVIESSSVRASDAENLNAFDFTFSPVKTGRTMKIDRTAGQLPPMEVPSPDGDLFFLAPRIVDYPDATINGSLLLLTQSPLAQEWRKIGIGPLCDYLSDQIHNTSWGQLAHTHSNKTVIDALSEQGGKLLFNGQPVTPDIPQMPDHYIAGTKAKTAESDEALSRVTKISFTAATAASESVDLEVVTINGQRFLHTSLPFFSDSEITAGGVGSGGGGSTGTLATLLDVKHSSGNVIQRLSGGDVQTGDLFLKGDSTHWYALAKGANGQILKMVNGIPSWASEAPGGVTSVSLNGGSPMTGDVALTGIITTANIGSQSVSYATNAGSAADASKLGGQLPSYYASAASLNNYLPLTGGTMTGDLYMQGNIYLPTNRTIIYNHDTAHAVIAGYNGSLQNRAAIDYYPDGYWNFTGSSDARVNGRVIYHSGNLTKSTLGLGNVENTALSTWAGSANITTLGTVAAGVWQGTAIADSYIASAATWNALKTLFESMFERHGSGTDSDPYLIHAKLPLYSDGEITAGGVGSGGGGSTGTLATLLDVRHSSDNVIQRLSGGDVQTGDLFLKGDSTHWYALAKGNDGQILKMVNGYPSWASEAPGGVTSVSLNDGSPMTGDVALTGIITTANIGSQSVSYATNAGSAADASKLGGQLPSYYINTANIGSQDVSSAEYIRFRDTRSANPAPYSADFHKGIEYALKENSVDGLSDGGNYHGVMTLHQWSDPSGSYAHQLGFMNSNHVYIRGGSTSWSDWSRLALTSDIPTAVSQLTNDSGYVPYWGTCANATYANNLKWEGENIVGSVSPIGAALSQDLNPNRLFGVDGDHIDIEYSEDGGATWQIYSATDSQKRTLLTGNYSYRLGASDTPSSVNDQLRITIDAGVNYLYFEARRLLMKVSTEGASGFKVRIDASTFDAPLTYVNIGEYTLGGWSGWNEIPLFFTFGNFDNTGNHYRKLRLTFFISGTPGSWNPYVSSIRMFGPNSWKLPSAMAKTGHIYEYDCYSNTCFPSNVQVSGALTVNGSFSAVDGHLSDRLYLSSAYIADMYLKVQTSSGSVYFGQDTIGGYVYEAGNMPLCFYIAGTERMRIDANGNVGIGTTSPSEKLHVLGNIVATGNTTTGKLTFTSVGSPTNADLEVVTINGQRFLHTSLPFFSDSEITAGGVGSGGGGSTGTLATLLDVKHSSGNVVQRLSGGDVQTGDLFLKGDSTHWYALAKGSNGQILKMVNGIPSWGDAPATGVTSISVNSGAAQTGAVALTVPTKTSDLTNDSGFITSSALNGYATQSWVNQQGYAYASALSGYLPLSGGTITGNLTINNSDTFVEFKRGSNSGAYFTYRGGSTWKVSDEEWQHDYELYHTGNIGSVISKYLPLSGGTVNGNLTVNGDLTVGGTLIASLDQGRLTWGGPAVSSNLSPIGAAMCRDANPNRLFGMPPDNISIEYSTNGGSSWQQYSTTDASKRNLVSTDSTYYIGGSYSATPSVNNRLRVTISAGDTLYCEAKKILIFGSNEGCQFRVRIEISSSDSGTSFTDLGEYKIDGWSGWADIPVDFFFGSNRYRRLRLTFYITSLDYSSNAYIRKIRLFAPNIWAAPSWMALQGEIYRFDDEGNVEFPANMDILGATNVTGTLSAASLTLNNIGGYRLLFEPQVNGPAISAYQWDWEPFRIDASQLILCTRSGGNVGIGTDSPSEKLHVAGNIVATGEITAGSASDARFKSNIEPLRNAIAVLNSLRPVEFDWNGYYSSRGGRSAGHDIGFVAQEVQPLIPSAISNIFGDYLRLDYTKFTPYLVAGWHSHEQRIEALERENTELKRQLSTLKS